MNHEVNTLIDRLEQSGSLDISEYEYLLSKRSGEALEYVAKKAVIARKKVYGNTIYIRGLIEVGNICRNDCMYCGIRRSNSNCDRYRLTKEQILECCHEGYEHGFRTFVMQGGEDGAFSAGRVCEIVSEIKKLYPDCAVTLSLGEYKRAEYKAMFNAGADRYLLRHETADKQHYEKLHPSEMSFENRMRCLYDLKDIGFQTGCGFMVGSPYQTLGTLAKDLKFIEEFSPQMCGIGPFIPHRDTPFGNMAAGTLELTLYLLSIVRLIKPTLLLPSTTALGTLNETGRERGILAGANVIMPNLSPLSVRKKYELYNNKLCSGAETAEYLNELRARMERIGYEIVIARGDIKE
ncbi:MAG: [Clostridia bacterium]|nr:[FeFe] hydrogenase H-cluster radical SAM maturase HydE [Clostridia bacterium]